jgi:nucleoside-diphosphate-sugar epimerase
VNTSHSPGQVVVTGAAGNLGAAVVARLRRDGRGVLATDRAGAHVTQDGAPLDVTSLDVTSFEATRAALAGAEAVVHLAAIPSPALAPAEVVFANNSVGTFNVLRAASVLGVSRVVIASSVAAYGMSFATPPASPVFAPITEAHPLLPSDPYGLSKQVNEIAAATVVRHQPELVVVALRFHWICTMDELHRRVGRVRDEPGIAAAELWGYVLRDDAVEAIARSLDVSRPGLHVANVCAGDSLSEIPTEELLRRYHPETDLRSPIPGCASLWSSAGCADLLGYAPPSTWR